MEAQKLRSKEITLPYQIVNQKEPEIKPAPAVPVTPAAPEITPQPDKNIPETIPSPEISPKPAPEVQPRKMNSLQNAVFGK